MSQFKQVLQFILDNAPASLKEYDRQNLNRKVTTTSENFGDIVYLDFRYDLGNKSVEASLQVGYDPIRPENGRAYHEDPNGDWFKLYKVYAKISWPSYGSDTIQMSEARINLMQEVLNFAKKIEFAFPECEKVVWSTKAEREEREAKRALEAAKQKNDAEVFALVQKHSKSMRVGSERRVDGTSVEPGTYNIPFGDKQFTVYAASHAINIMRTQ